MSDCDCPSRGEVPHSLDCASQGAPDRPGDRDQQQAADFVADIVGAPTPEYRDDVERELADALAAARVEGYRTGVADAERGIYVPGSEALAAARAEEAARWQAKIEALAVEHEDDYRESNDPSDVFIATALRSLLDES